MAPYKNVEAGSLTITLPGETIITIPKDQKVFIQCSKTKSDKLVYSIEIYEAEAIGDPNGQA